MSDVVERIKALPLAQQALLLQQLKQQTIQTPSLRAKDWVIRLQPQSHPRLRLFCFAYAGGGASLFRLWPHGLPDDVEICAVQLPGRENRLGETAYNRLPTLIHDLSAALMPLLDRPFACFGHSMGALISFEFTRYLRKTTPYQPIALYLAAFRAPQLPSPNIKIYHLPTEVFKVVLEAEGIPLEILRNDELMRGLLPTLRADLELCDTYNYHAEPPLSCPLRIFGGQDDIRVRPTDLDGWSLHTQASYQQTIVPGNHFFVHSAHDHLLALIAQDLPMA